MHVLVVTPPDPLVDLATAKAHLRVDDDDQDTLIGAYIAAACAHIDGPGGWLGRAVGAQELEAQFDSFPLTARGALDLPFPPLLEVSAVTYDDADAAAQTLDPTVYLVDPRGLLLAPEKSWPSSYSRRGAVRVTYTAGYAEIPPSIVAAILLMVGDLFENRESAVTGTIAAAIPMSTTVERLLAPFRVWSF